MSLDLYTHLTLWFNGKALYMVEFYKEKDYPVLKTDAYVVQEKQALPD